MMRQRLVGALVLLCGGVILWTLLFTGPAEYKVDRQSQIPPEPRVDPVLGISPERPGGIASADRPLVAPQPQLAPKDVEPQAEAEPDKSAATDASRNEPEPDNSNTADLKGESTSKPQPESKPQAVKETASESSRLDDYGLAEAWVIQVGSFSKEANATSLKERLQKGGHKAYIDQREYRSKPVYRVLVGPLLNRNTADSEKKNIDARFGVSSLVTRFEAKP